MKKAILINLIVIITLIVGGLMYYTSAKIKQNVNNKSNKEVLVADKSNKNMNLDKKTSSESEGDFIKNYVAQIGVPNKKQKDKINHAPRYGDRGFEAEMIDSFKFEFGDDLSEEKIKKLLDITYELAYKHEVILDDYANNKLSRIQVFEAMNENSRQTMEKERKILTDEEFKKMYKEGEDSAFLDIEAIKENEFLMAFDVNKKKYNIHSAKDLDKHFTEEEKKNALEIVEWRIKEEYKINKQFEKDDNFSLFKKKEDEIEKLYYDKLKSFLTQKQLDILGVRSYESIKKEEEKMRKEIEKIDEDEDDDIPLDESDGWTKEQRDALNRGEVIRVE